ncbi:MAG: NADPH-dependent F420 reductase [Thermoanaerobaculia bacterium]
MKIAIIGAGSVGGALGRGWARAGHEVTFGVRNPSDPKVQKLVEETGARAASVADAAAGAEVVVFATPWGATQDALKSAGDLSGKVVFDCTNPLAPNLSGLTHGFDTSAAEQVASWASQARVVKVFNTTGANNMADPDYNGLAATMFYCGNDAEAKAVAGRLAADLGFDPVDAGNLEQARLLEPLALLWIRLAYTQGLGREIAFRLMKR